MTQQKIVASVLAAALAAVLAAPAAYAATYNNGTATASFKVSLTLKPDCDITANPLNFGSVGVVAAALSQSTTLAVTCTNSTPYNIGLDQGTVAGSVVGTRLMAGTAAGNTSSTIGFRLYSDSAHTTIWGNTQGTNTVGGTGTGAALSVPIYGQVPVPTTMPKPDTYQTTITATVYF